MGENVRKLQKPADLQVLFRMAEETKETKTTAKDDNPTHAIEVKQLFDWDIPSQTEIRMSTVRSQSFAKLIQTKASLYLCGVSSASLHFSTHNL